MEVETESKNDKENQVPMDTTESNETAESNKEDLLCILHAKIDEVLSQSQLNSADYNSLGDISRNNPLVIESKLHEILKRILLEEKLSENDKVGYDQLMLDIIDAIVRLRRDQKIVSWILIALDQSLKKNIGNIEEAGRINVHVLSAEFINKFSASIAKLTHSQVSSVLSSLIYHFNSILIDSMDDVKPTFSLAPGPFVIFSQVIKDLSVAFLEGVNAFDVTWPLSGKQKFVTGLANLGIILSKLFKTLKRNMKHKDYIIVGVNLWKIVESWQTLTAFIKYYVGDAVSENDWNSIVNSCELCESNFQKIDKSEETHDCLGFLKMKENRIECITNICNNLKETEPKNNKTEDLEGYWRILLDNYPQTIENLNNAQISKLSELLIEHLDICREKLILPSIQNNESLNTALIFQIFKKISEILVDSNSVTQQLTNKIGNANWEDEKHHKILKSCKKILSGAEWAIIEDEKSLTKILKYLELLLHLPLIYCSTELKILIFLTTITIKKETSSQSSFSTLCLEILSDVSEKYNEDLLQYIQPEILISQLSNSQKILTRIIEFSLINPANYETLKKCIKTHVKDTNVSTMIVECIDKIKSKVKIPEEKKLLVKFEKKLYKKILSEMDGGTLNATHLKNLTVALKTAVALKKVDESLTNKINGALKTLMADNDLKYSKESYQFIKTILEYRKNGIPLNKTTIKDIWSVMLKKSCNEIVPPLIEASDLKALLHACNFLRKQTLQSLDGNNEDSFQNCMIIWNSIAKSDMGANREKIRQNAFQGLLQMVETKESLINTNMKLNIIRLFINIVSSKRMILSDKTIDLIFLIANSVMNESALTVSHQTLELCSALLKFRLAIAIDNLSIIIRLYLKSIQIIVQDARQNSEHQQLHCLIALEIQKLASAFVKLKKDIARLSPYIIADFIGIYYGGGIIPDHVKEPLDDSVSQFLSVCDPHAISLLSRALPPSMQEIFKTLYETYTKFYKFTGKV